MKVQPLRHEGTKKEKEVFRRRVSGIKGAKFCYETLKSFFFD
jgi:hypothetical protein